MATGRHRASEGTEAREGTGPREGMEAREGTGARGFLEGARAFHREHGVVDVLAVVGRQRVIRVQPGRSASEIAVLAVHVDELVAADRRGGSPRA